MGKSLVSGRAVLLRFCRSGFTLIEMAMVLVVVGLMLSGAMAGLTPILDSSKISTTNKKMQRVELALLAYVMQNGCLPCPANGSLDTNSTDGGWSQSNADYYGPGDTATVAQNRPCAGSVGTGCAANQGGGTTVGVVPWLTLGLRESDAVDAWSDRISYAVTPALTVTAGSSMVRTLPTSYPAGTLTVSNNSGTTQTSSAGYVLISHGRDRVFAFTAGSGKTIVDTVGYTGFAQGINSPTVGNGTTFRQDIVSPKEGTSHFDDIVRYRTASTIVNECGKNACGNPP